MIPAVVGGFDTVGTMATVVLQEFAPLSLHT